MVDADQKLEHDLERELREWLPKVRRLLFRLRGFRGEVDDLAQEVFLRWWAGRGRLRDPRRERSFLFGIAVRVHQEEVRRRVHETEITDRSGGHGDPVAATIAAELRGDAERALRDLPLPLREVLALSVYEGMTPTEIAETLALSAEAVRHRLFRARTAMRDALSSHLREYGT